MNDQRAKRRKTNKIILSVFGGFILLIIIIAVASGSGNKNKPVSNQTASSPSTAASTTPSQPTTAQQVATWVTKYGTIFTTLENDFTTMSKDAGNSDVSAVQTDCQKINTDVTAAQGYPAIPDAQTASDFSSALSYYESGSKDCVTAVNNNDSNGLVQAAHELSQGNDKITAANTDIKNLGA